MDEPRAVGLEHGGFLGEEAGDLKVKEEGLALGRGETRVRVGGRGWPQYPSLQSGGSPPS